MPRPTNALIPKPVSSVKRKMIAPPCFTKNHKDSIIRGITEDYTATKEVIKDDEYKAVSGNPQKL